MKKKEIIIVILTALLLSLFILLGIFALFFNAKDEEMQVDKLGAFGEYTYMFSGKSDHYSFDNGFVYYGDEIKKISIDDFKQNKEIDGLVSEEVFVSFNDNIVFSKNNTKNLNSLDKQIDISYVESAKECQSESNCEWDAFTITNANNFKDSIKVSIKYCTNANCSSEIFTLEYKDKISE